jgi:Valyl-tRNA synthetase
VPVISDNSIDKEMGTGAEMVCTFGDKNDINMYYRHKLQLVDAIDESGILKNAGRFSGMDIPEARSAIVKELEANSALLKREEMKHTVKAHDRCSTPIELLSYTQWFLKTKESANKIKEAASSINWVPPNAKQRLIDWADFIEWDWNISRNRIFGTPIPFWYCADCGEIIPPKAEELPVNPASDEPKIGSCKKCGSSNIKGEKDVCDVWVDSAITPLVISGWPDDKELMTRAFPCSVRIQGTDIVRTWAFYTIFRIVALTGDKPFEDLLVHNMILNEEGKEMHKSLGTGLSPEALVDKYSIDAVRLWVAGSGGIGKDKPFSYSEVEYSKSFISKLYNSALFVKGALGETKLPKEEPHKSFGVFDFWIMNRLNDVTKEIGAAYDALNLYEASNKLIDFFWHEFCDYYIENVKYRVRDDSSSGMNSRKAAVYTLHHVLQSVLIMLSPMIPHAAEEINSMFSKESIFMNEFPKYRERESKADYVINGLVFKSALVDFDYSDAGNMLNTIISDVRKERSKARIALNKEVKRININVPEVYYTVVFSSKKELQSICKSSEISVESGDGLQVSIEL